MLTRQAFFTSNMHPAAFKVANFIGFQSIWMLGVFYGNQFLAISAALIALHFVITPQRRSDFATMAAVASVGMLVDNAFSLSGIFVFDTLLIPPWLALMWCGFALTLGHSLVWLSRFPPVVQALFGAFGGTSSYYAGYRFGAVEYSYDTTLTLAAMACAWAVMMPVFCYMVKRNAPAV